MRVAGTRHVPATLCLLATARVPRLRRMKRLRVGLLGPVAVWCGDQRLDITAGKIRALVTLLALQGGRDVSRSVIVDEGATGTHAHPERGKKARAHERRSRFHGIGAARVERNRRRRQPHARAKRRRRCHSRRCDVGIVVRDVRIRSAGTPSGFSAVTTSSERVGYPRSADIWRR